MHVAKLCSYKDLLLPVNSLSLLSSLISCPSRLVIFLRILPFLLRTEVGTEAQLDLGSLLLMLFILAIDLLQKLIKLVANFGILQLVLPKAAKLRCSLC